MYRPPNTPVSFWDDLQSTYDLACNVTTGKHVVLGDFNADPRTTHGNKISSFSNFNNLSLHVHEPTRITDKTSTCLDKMLTNIPNFVKNVKVLPPVANNDHCTIAASLLFRNTCKKSCFDRLIWLFSQAIFHNFRDALNKVDWDTCFMSDDPNEIGKSWSSAFLNTARQHVPNRIINVRQGDAPWYTTSLHAQKRKLDRIHDKAK